MAIHTTRNLLWSAFVPKPPRLPPDKVFAEIEAQLARLDRAPFRKPLAEALGVAPSRSAWRKLAKNDPGKWSSAVATLAKSAGMPETVQSISVNLEPQQLANQLVTRYGTERAREMLKMHGLPENLIPIITIESAG